MNEQKYLYVLFSATPYRMGRWIRFVTGEPYNHVSIATGEDLTSLYSFARRYYRTPFYGGFVAEDPCRYRHNGVTANIRLYRLPLTSKQWQRLQDMLADMREHADRYLYNHLSAMAAPLHLKVRVRKAFTCAEFTVNVLSTLGFDFDPNRFIPSETLPTVWVLTISIPETSLLTPAKTPASSSPILSATLWWQAPGICCGCFGDGICSIDID